MGSNAESVESSLRAVFEKSGVRAAAWCLVKDGRVISQAGFGFADSAKARRADAESTVFRAGSNGKVFVALSTLLVEAESRLDLRADVNSILKRVRLPETFDAPRHARSSPHPYRRFRGPLPRRAGSLARCGRPSE
jgi:CubicO group peptidase (beta-lactamase class C family)